MPVLYFLEITCTKIINVVSTGFCVCITGIYHMDILLNIFDKIMYPKVSVRS